MSKKNNKNSRKEFEKISDYFLLGYWLTNDNYSSGSTLLTGAISPKEENKAKDFKGAYLDPNDMWRQGELFKEVSVEESKSLPTEDSVGENEKTKAPLLFVSCPNGKTSKNILLAKDIARFLRKARKPKSHEKNRQDNNMTLDSFITASANILPKAVREEFKGDLIEIRNEMKEDGVPIWHINVVSIWNIFTAYWSAVSGKAFSLFFPKSDKERNK